jgi:acetolactate synthase-1/2/3 large subunit
VLFVVFNNGRHGMCVTRQRRFFEGRVACATYDAVDVALTSRGFAPEDRLWVRKARSAAELTAALADYEKAARPGVLELVLAAEEIPPFAPLLSDAASTYVVRRAGEAAQSAA